MAATWLMVKYTDMHCLRVTLNHAIMCGSEWHVAFRCHMQMITTMKSTTMCVNVLNCNCLYFRLRQFFICSQKCVAHKCIIIKRYLLTFDAVYD